MNHRQEIFYMEFAPDIQPPEILKIGKQSLHLPSTPIASLLPAVLGSWFFTSFTMWCNNFNTTFVKELIVQFIAVVSSINTFVLELIVTQVCK